MENVIVFIKHMLLVFTIKHLLLLPIPHFPLYSYFKFFQTSTPPHDLPGKRKGNHEICSANRWQKLFREGKVVPSVVSKIILNVKNNFNSSKSVLLLLGKTEYMFMYVYTYIWYICIWIYIKQNIYLYF